MTIQEHLAAFDGWLTDKIEAAHDAGKDLAFREAESHGKLSAAAWEYSLLEPGHVIPDGEGWSVYRLQGIWPEFLADPMFGQPQAHAR